MIFVLGWPFLRGAANHGRARQHDALDQTRDHCCLRRLGVARDQTSTWDFWAGAGRADHSYLIATGRDEGDKTKRLALAPWPELLPDEAGALRTAWGMVSVDSELGKGRSHAVRAHPADGKVITTAARTDESSNRRRWPVSQAVGRQSHCHSTVATQL